MQYYGEGTSEQDAIYNCVQNIERDDHDLVYVRENIITYQNADGTWIAHYDSSKYY
ncbi:hypothetical protein ACFDAA_11945 [Enterococcus casseliflavus]|uniref:hypothetical protein n=1 Tax=Enterococcus casseliflavus TaxID=37734 RepID=UPI0039A4389F